VCDIGDVQTQSTQAMSLSYRLHKLLQSSSADSRLVRGSRQSDRAEMSVAASLYTLVRADRSNRRYLLMTLLKRFENDSVCRLTPFLFKWI